MSALQLFNEETRGQVSSPKQQHFGEEEMEAVGEDEEVVEEMKEEEEEEEEDGSDHISPIIDFLDDDLGHTVAEAEGEFVWKKASSWKKDKGKSGTGGKREDDFLSVESRLVQLSCQMCVNVLVPD